MSLHSGLERPRGGSPAPLRRLARARVRTRAREVAIPVCTVAVLFAFYTVFSVRRHDLMLTSGYDLGIFEQAVRSYAGGHWPVASLKGPNYNLLGDHFSPITATIAPFYRIWPSALTLLVAQAFLFALAAYPLCRWAQRSVGRAAALTVGLAYGTSWGIASAVVFDFHEIAFAVPLLAFSLAALGERRWRGAVGWALPLVLVKEDLGFTLAAIGAYVAWYGSRRLGLATAVFGVAASLVEMFVVLASVNEDGYAYTQSLGGDPATGTGSVPERLLAVPQQLVWPEPKVHTLLFLAALTGFVALRSPLVLLCLPTLGWRFLSGNASYWETRFHYSAVLMPIVFAAFIDVLARRRRAAEPGGPEVRRAAKASQRASLGITAAVALIVLPLFPYRAYPDLFTTDPHVTAARAVLAAIPDGASVTASNRLVPQLTGRCDVVLLGYPQMRPRYTTQWIVSDTKAAPSGWPMSAEDEAAVLEDARAQGYRTAAEQDGVVLLERTAAAGAAP
ncbi:DUF2079 domain-containing protein [Streptomyces sp. NPDC091268]|uniref:DUF2079 domain-containing protein n=1 Tax=Streptomyces sp. NPDC091268 TaxID=3365979 RepID=UPI00382470CE